jgi:hypothetical protein
MGANGDAGSSTIGSPSTSFGARHAGDPIEAPRGDISVLIRDYPSCVGNVDIRVHLEQVDPSEMCAVPTNANADDLPSGPAVTLTAMCEPAQAFYRFSPKAPVPIAPHLLDPLKACRHLVGR